MNAQLYISNDTADHSKEKIIGGHVVDIKSYPYQVSIMLFGSHYCGGSIITPFHILTAAHCIERYPHIKYYQVRSGSSYSIRGGVVSKVSQLISHEDYEHEDDPEYVVNDIAILVLDKPLTYNEATQNITLISRPTEEGEEAYVSGWGRTRKNVPGQSKTLKALRLNVTKDALCMYSDLSEKKICGVSGNTDSACNGDSGGPLAVQGYLAGIASTNPSQGCGNLDEITVFTSVWHHKNWIEKQIDNHMLNRDLNEI